ncbi:MAG: hypothetical protein ACD_54C00530G0001, partial [uncultured bacterium]
LRPGDPIRMTEALFSTLAEAFLAAMTERFAA